MILLMSSEMPVYYFLNNVFNVSTLKFSLSLSLSALATLKPQAAGYMAPGAERVCVENRDIAQSVNFVSDTFIRLENRCSRFLTWQWRPRY